MASAQVLRKQEHLEAGKRKLEEFRKKKAAERAKKATSAVQANASIGGSNEKQESERLQLTDSDLVGTSDSVGAAFPESSATVLNNDIKKTETSQKSSFNFSYDESTNASGSAYSTDNNSLFPVHFKLENKEFRGDDALQFSEQLNVNYSLPGKKEIGGVSESAPSGLGTDQYVALQLPSGTTDITSRHFVYDALNETLPNNSDNYLKDFSVINSSRSHASYPNGFPENSGNVLRHDQSGYGDRFASSFTSSWNEDFKQSAGTTTRYFSEVEQKMGVLEPNNSVISDLGENKYSFSPPIASASNSTLWSPDSNSVGFSSSNYGQPSLHSAGNSISRSRPSFLDSINISRGPASTPQSGSLKVEPFSSKVFPEDTLGSSVSWSSTNSAVASGNGVELFNHAMGKNMENRQDFYSQKPDEDFSALEQHIEDLTQEKFSLQRALEASRTLAESLAAENSSLTDSYNQQGSVVNQLKSDMEKLQREIKAKLVELESVKIEYTNAQLECNAADERAKLLASEVIGCEEKALRLKSNGLKLERQLEESQAEISSFKKKMSSLEKERQDLQSTVDALQEEKKLLQSKLREAAKIRMPVDDVKTPVRKADVSTSTDDLGDSRDTDGNVGIPIMEGYLNNDISSQQLQQENGQISLQDIALSIPPDQMRMIENINTIISELALEKEELMQALSAESSQSSKLKELNKELTRKLEAQTQRLELLTSQNMVNDGIPARQLDSRLVHDNPTYADEGDEVVERVLSWIMKLFPGGPSKRRTSKLL